MPAPTVVAVGSATTGATTAVTPAFPAGLAANDILIGIGESAGAETYPAAATNGFAHVTGSPNTQDTQTTLTVIWARYDGVMTAHSWGDSGNHNMGRYIAIRGCPTSGNPWDVVTVTVESVANNSAEWPQVTTTVADTLILFIIATGRDIASTANLGALSGGTGLSAFTERMDDWTAAGTGGGFGLATATKAAAGATGTTVTATMGSTDTKALMTLALKEAPPAAPIPPILVMAPPQPA